MKFDISVLSKIFRRKFKFNYLLTRITCTLHEDQYVFFLPHFAQFLGREMSIKVVGMAGDVNKHGGGGE
jgi:hypothetical protein